jgi:hypothetical protein
VGQRVDLVAVDGSYFVVVLGSRGWRGKSFRARRHTSSFWSIISGTGSRHPAGSYSSVGRARC